MSDDSPSPNSEPLKKSSRWRSILGFLGAQLFPVLVIVWINGLIVRTTVRDSVDLVAPLYYATPWPVLAVLTLPFIWTFRRQPKMVFGVIVLAHLFGGAWLLEDWRSGEPSKEPSDLRVVQWNVDRPVSGIPTVAKRLRDYDADILAVSEPMPKIEPGDPERWRREFPEYEAQFAPGNILCLIRGEAKLLQTGFYGPASFYALYDVLIRDREFRVLQVDGNANPTTPRRGSLIQLTALADSLRDRPLVVIGDFNAPRDSVHIAGMRTHFTNAFEAAGFGCGATWPAPLPLLSLDQVWCGAGLIPVRCRHEVTFHSDHRPVVAELKFAP